MSDVVERVRAYALSLPEVRAGACWGEEAFFHQPPGGRRCLFLTIRDEGGRPVLGMPLPRATFESWFGAPPARPRRGQRIASVARCGPFAPHRLYAWRAWVEAAAPEEEHVMAIAWAVREAYALAVAREA